MGDRARFSDCLQRSKRALAARLDAQGYACNRPGYLDSPEQNLINQAGWELISVDLKSGAGSELGKVDSERPKKFCAAHSSSVLAVNTFGRWRRDPRSLALVGLGGFSDLRFEGICRAGVRGTAPHLDVLLQSGDAVLAIESKCTEFITPKSASFAESYGRIVDDRRRSAWFRFVVEPALRASFAHLDVGQLVKHCFGLSHTYRARRVVLLYLFWEPSNAADFAAFKAHRQELELFAQVVAEDQWDFRYQSYPELWDTWSASQSTELIDHVRSLRARYEVQI